MEYDDYYNYDDVPRQIIREKYITAPTPPIPEKKDDDKLFLYFIIILLICAIIIMNSTHHKNMIELEKRYTKLI